MEKIDVIKEKVFCYDENCELLKSLNLSDFQNIDFGYLDGAKLFSLNISQPIKRVVKFSEINGLDSSAEFVEYPYSEMSEEQKADFDSFVQQAETL
jgi:hypothetical protein